MHINAHFLGGEDIESACRDACALAARINCDVHFTFNDVKCMAFPYTRPKDLIAAWREAAVSDSHYKIAAGHVRAS